MAERRVDIEEQKDNHLDNIMDIDSIDNNLTF